MKILSLYLLSVGVLLGSVCMSQDNDSEDELSWSYQGKKYVTTIPSAVLNASPDFDLANRTLPKSIKEITTAAFNQLEKVTGSKNGWRVMAIDLRQSLHNEKKWYYAVSFDNAPSPQGVVYMIYIAVTVDGRLGVIKEIQERTIE
jgi:hypothetical protein